MLEMGNKTIKENDELSINSLPDEILAGIFELILNSDASNKLSILLVSRRWKSVIESWHIFQENSVFEKPRSHRKLSIAEGSSRRFRSFTINYNSTHGTDYEKIQRVLKTSEKTLKKIVINLELSYRFEFREFYEILKSFQNLEILTIHFKCALIQPSKDFNPPKINYRNLEELTIDWDFGEDVTDKFILPYINTPRLKKFKRDHPRNNELTGKISNSKINFYAVMAF
jgi:hypothetical protein